ncbi:MAG: hypothetical protein H0W96_02075 [Solirubrobacterales bacterium]|nr:hypothetical protein [Solirubrobacterales bacterium]
MADPNICAETEDERLNRQLDQLLQELRVAMAGVQVAVRVPADAVIRRRRQAPPRGDLQHERMRL